MVVHDLYVDDDYADYRLLGWHSEDSENRVAGGCVAVSTVPLHLRASAIGDLRVVVWQHRHFRDFGGVDVCVVESEVV